MSAFNLTLGLHEQGADLSRMMDEWIKLSVAKNWPQNEEGWRRYLARAAESGSFAKVKATKVSTSKMVPVPDDFRRWWADHVEGRQQGVPAEVGYRCRPYRDEWMDECRKGSEKKP